MVLGQFFCQFTGSAAQTHCARRPQPVSKKFLEEEILREQIFASWRLIAKIVKISASQKFPTIQYIHAANTTTVGNHISEHGGIKGCSLCSGN